MVTSIAFSNYKWWFSIVMLTFNGPLTIHPPIHQPKPWSPEISSTPKVMDSRMPSMMARRCLALAWRAKWYELTGRKDWDVDFLTWRYPKNDGIFHRKCHSNNSKWPPVIILFNPRCSMYGIFTYIWDIFGVNVGKYSIHGASGNGIFPSKPSSYWDTSILGNHHMGISQNGGTPKNDGWFHGKSQTKNGWFRSTPFQETTILFSPRNMVNHGESKKHGEPWWI